MNMVGDDTWYSISGPENFYQYNGIERNKDFDLNIDMAFFRSYDASIGRWWQIDPKNSVRESAYIGMANNPVVFSDVLGDTTHLYNTSGEYIYTIWGKGNSEIHFIENDDINVIKEWSQIESREAIARFISEYFIRDITMVQLSEQARLSDKEELERPFMFYYTQDNKELQIEYVELPDEGDYRTVQNVSIPGDRTLSVLADENNMHEGKIYRGYGHTHPEAAAKLLKVKNTAKTLNKPTMLFSPVDYNNKFNNDRNKHYPAMITTQHGVTIYTTAKYKKPKISNYGIVHDYNYSIIARIKQ